MNRPQMVSANQSHIAGQDIAVTLANGDVPADRRALFCPRSFFPQSLDTASGFCSSAKPCTAAGNPFSDLPHDLFDVDVFVFYFEPVLIMCVSLDGSSLC